MKSRVVTLTVEHADKHIRLVMISNDRIVLDDIGARSKRSELIGIVKLDESL